MKTWCLVEESGNLLTLTAESPPAFIEFGAPGWHDTVAEAIRHRRTALDASVRAARDELGRAEARMRDFNRAVEHLEVYQDG